MQTLYDIIWCHDVTEPQEVGGGVCVCVCVGGGGGGGGGGGHFNFIVVSHDLLQTRKISFPCVKIVILFLFKIFS